MIAKDKVLVVDVDGTLCGIVPAGGSYADAVPEMEMIGRLRALHADGWRIILQSARGMRSFDGNAGEINARVLPVLLAWLAKHQVPFDEIYMGKPWAGQHGFYVDDRAVRPREFLTMSDAELDGLCVRDRLAGQD